MQIGVFNWKITLLVKFRWNLDNEPSGIFCISSLVSMLMTSFPVFFTVVCANSQFVYNKIKCDGDLEIKTVFYSKTEHLRTWNIFLEENMPLYTH